MSAECIRNCPLIIDATGEANSFSNNAANLSLIYGPKNVEAIVKACEASYDCNGPVIKDVEVVKGFIRKRTEVQKQTSCGLPEN